MKANLQKWLNEGSLVKHKTNEKEIADLFRIVARDLKDAQIKELSIDRRFATAYNAALQLCTIIILVSGYRIKAKNGHHLVTILSVPELFGSTHQKRCNFFNACRTKRNITDYDREGEISESELHDLLSEVITFEEEIRFWILKKHPTFKIQMQ